jgi:NCAIR mutase (PurE)-related protein
MSPEHLKTVLKEVQEGKLDLEKAFQKIKDLPYKDLDFAKLDTHREIRIGYPEVIYCAGKTIEQIEKIFDYLLDGGSNILATRASEEVFQAVQKLESKAVYHKLAQAITVKKKEIPLSSTYIAVVTGGTSDQKVADEAAVTAEIFGSRVENFLDVGVAGIHRLFDSLEKIRSAKVIIAVAGMEGALPGILGGMVGKPIIAVPTSVGYGANFGGLSALLTMLNSCAPGISVVNIDNGFGAGYLANQINQL